MKKKLLLSTLIIFFLVCMTSIDNNVTYTENTSTLELNIKILKAKADPINCKTICQFDSFAMCVFKYPYGCLGKRIAETT